MNTSAMEGRADEFVSRAVEAGRIADTPSARRAWHTAYMKDPAGTAELFAESNRGTVTAKEEKLRHRLDTEQLTNDEKISIVQELRKLRGIGAPKKGAPPVPSDTK